MGKVEQHLVSNNMSVSQVLARLDELAADAILFVIDENQKLLGSLTDGDIRRGLIRGIGLDSELLEFVQPRPKFFKKGAFDLNQMEQWRAKNFRIIPVLDEEDRIVDIVNFRLQKSYLPIDAVIMAGGKGTRLRPLTLNTPKPLLKVGNKPIIEHNIDRLRDFGLRNITLTIKYLGQQLIDYFGDGAHKGLNIQYIQEEKALGTVGAVALIDHFDNDYVLVMNSDLLTNINYEDLFKDLLDKDADMVVATTPYEVAIPYGVIETKGDRIVAIQEKPTYTYYSNAGIYIFKRAYVDLIPKGKHFNATDLMEVLYANGKKVVHYPILDYWLDIGKPYDYEKAQQDIKHIKF